MLKLFLILFLALPVMAERKVEVLVCLCDNDHQGIVKVGAKIGNGMDPAGNLYWGCSDGMSAYFKKSKKWKLVERLKPEEGRILETLKFKHHSGKVTLLAHAYRGDRMKQSIEEFFAKARDAGEGDMVVFIGHNGMMDNVIDIPQRAKKGDEGSQSIVLGCLTEKYFSKPLLEMNSEPLLLTKSLMYPGAFLLHDALEVWLRDGSRAEIREAAAKAYANNQRISVKGGRSIFSKLE